MRSIGISALHRAFACGQRGWNVQPVGGFSGFGTSPATGVRDLPVMFRSGTASSSMCVYGCRGVAKIVRLGASSTTRPRYITPTRSAM